MSDGDPSLEEDVPAPLLPQQEDAFHPKPSTPLYTGNTLRLQYRNSHAEESVAFLNEAKSLDLHSPGNLPKDESSGFFQMEEEAERKPGELQAMSVLSMFPDNLSQEMNTDRDNESEASTRIADECPHDRGGGDAGTLDTGGTDDAPQQTLLPDLTATNCNNVPNHCRITMIDPATNPSLFFRDGKRSIDFVLVWEAQTDLATTPEARHRREIFEGNLEAEGLQLEREAPEGLCGLNFVKIHTPLSVLKRYSEILKLRMPMKEELCKVEKGTQQSAILNAALRISKLPAFKDVHRKTGTLLEKMDNAWDRICSGVRVDESIFPPRSHRFTAIYSRDKEYLFDVKAPCFWTASVRSRIVQFVLDRQRFSRDARSDFSFGIERLISIGIYSAAYPLHDGDLKTPGTMRYLLYNEWSAVARCMRYQPLDYVKDYFGVKIALYFAWLGFYTHMLIPAAIVGLICFIYSVSTLHTNVPSVEICNDNSSIKMCPLCDYWCDYWDLKETCLYARIGYMFDNPTTVFFACFMSFWATLFLELWKRYSAEITHRWDLTGFDVHEEHPRPTYLARLANVKRKQVNIVTNTLEPMVPFWRVKVPATIFSFSMVMLLVLLAVATVLAVVLYRMSVLAALSVQGQDSLITSNAILFTSATAASINLCLICVFNYIYQFLAEYLTEKELLRTQTEFDDSLTLKIYLLQFVNYYASIFYIAFFKGKLIGRPGRYIRLFNFRQEECGPGGCLIELCIQLAIIMVGKQAVNTLVEMLMPFFFKWLNLIRTLGRGNSLKSPLQWVKDFKLVDFGHMGLFPEYLEMVLQYGFVTIFVAAFPLAPLFALLNNVLEMRLDARKLLQCYRRPVPQRVSDIGVWYRILDSIGKLSVITNGFIIAFTSEFIPRLVYRLHHSDDGTLSGYVNYSLAVFNVSDLEPGSEPHKTNYNGTLCRFPGYLEPPTAGDHHYERTSTYYHILGARLAFVVVFENVVALVMIIVRWCIPDMSCVLRDKIRREAYVTNEIIISREAQRARSEMTPATPGETIGTWNQLLSNELSGSDFDLACHAAAENSADEREKEADTDIADTNMADPHNRHNVIQADRTGADVHTPTDVV